ncbi:uncharacterized protein LOC123673461 [Harmonia axyridis]|uniref:uncharacterized protein LOC123673461 n=1 Tax=Harmonia axyridis TaxID=115357 RepID=UPI001E276F7C|nr:uncharacterized protein LOC123673461 [Harmonia axyridis]XP_045463907.1 uncharacterized protein LOC123673461 [Harmonia axyridis]XP_045463908.1 uncharacterized protein LOC123673461 [Harmonia axyridis]XP_045463909.1 uncharacterized protein LOC123673461 [Harmonia axyridis]
MVNSHLNFEELYFKYFYCSDNPVCTKIAFNMNEVNNNLTCDICKKKFSRVWVKNRHLKDIHHVEEKKSESRKAVHMKCPICPEEEKKPFDSHGILSTHLEEIHSISIKTSLLNFRNEEEFEAWRATDNRTANYTKRLSKNTKNGLLVYYECNRSYFSGYTSQCSKRNMKTGGSIKISGFCPSRIHAKFSSAGVSVKYVETHVGHKDELRSKHLSKKQQEIIAGKLMSGVTKEKILEDARILTNDKLERINVLTRGDLDYIIRKFNINKRKHDDDMIAIESKVRREVHSKAESGVAEKPLGMPIFPAVDLMEEKSDSVLGVGTSVDDDYDSYICKPSPSTDTYEMDGKNFMNETLQKSNISVDSSTKIDIVLQEARRKLQLLDEDSLRKVAKAIDEKYNLIFNNPCNSRKRKRDK